MQHTLFLFSTPTFVFFLSWYVDYPFSLLLKMSLIF